MKNSILIVEDKKSVLTALEMLLRTEYDEVITLSNPKQLISTITNNKIDVILLDMNFNAGQTDGNEGLYWLREIQKLDANIIVIMITAYGAIELAVETVKNGAFNFILKPWDNNKILATVHSALELRKSKLKNHYLNKSTRNIKKEFNTRTYTLIGKSEAMIAVLEIVRKVANTNANILITGENGTGKELIAREIHRLSNRKNELLINVDMGAVSETLFESELFGHKKGAFTDAKNDRIGKFETANKGTLFLDEIGNLSIALQAKILSAIENRTITKLGDNKKVPIDIRLISATNKDISSLIAEGKFREDLLYRINTIQIELPPLRERGDDILLLANYYLDKYSKKYHKFGLKLTKKAQYKLLEYEWLGNVRELKHSIEKAVILSDKNLLDCQNFSFGTKDKKKLHLPELTIDEMEKQMILDRIKIEDGNLSLVAKKLGITRQTLYNKLKKYNI